MFWVNYTWRKKKRKDPFKLKGKKKFLQNTYSMKKRLLNRLHGIHRSLLDGCNPFLENLHKQLWWEYEVVLFEEEALWAQKARSHWIAQGDRNTKYFHSLAMVRRKEIGF